MPGRGSLALKYTYGRETIWKYRDWFDVHKRNSIGVTDATGNTGKAVHCADALFVTGGYQVGSLFTNNDDVKSSAVASIVSETHLTLEDLGVTGNSKHFTLKGLDDTGLPKIKARIKKADQKIRFVVELFNPKDEGLNDDFNDFIRNLGKFIYDGQAAKYIEDGVNKTDTKGNVIRINLSNYDFNDNKFYGDIGNKVFIEVEFEGGIYVDTDPETEEIEVPVNWTSPNSSIQSYIPT
jgi:hypothetical protein